MSILIKGMEMPTHCIDCPFMMSRDDDNCILQSAETNASFENWGQMKADCPLIPVPPHGDLIERDKLREKEFIHDGDAYAVVMSRDIRNAPTIIPADPAKEVDDERTD